MELHEFRVGQRRPGPVRQGEARAEGAGRVGAVANNPPSPPVASTTRFVARTPGPAGPATARPATAPSCRSSRRASPVSTVIEGVRARAAREGAHDLAPGGGTRRVDDPAPAVRAPRGRDAGHRPARSRRRRRDGPVPRPPPGRRRGSPRRRRGRTARPRPRGCRRGAPGSSSGPTAAAIPALRPGAGGAVARRGEEDHRLGRQRQGGEETGEPGPDHDRPAVEGGGHSASIRSTARRGRGGDGRIDRHRVATLLQRPAGWSRGCPLHVRAQVARRMNATSGCRTATLSLIEHSVSSTTCPGRRVATKSDITAVEPEKSASATTSGGHSGWRAPPRRDGPRAARAPRPG